MEKLSSSDVNASNIVRPTVDELSAEDRQAYEAFIKECEEENTRRKERNRREASVVLVSLLQEPEG